jgi:hypothetical protein
MFVFESGSRYVDLATPEYGEPPERIVDGVRWWLEHSHGPGDMADKHPQPVIVPASKVAQNRLDAHLNGICRQRATEDDTRAALWSRATGKTAKLALLLACSRETGRTGITIELEDVERAVKISNWLTRRMIYQAYRHVSHNQREGEVKQVLRMLTTRLSRTELTRRTQWLDKRKRDEILQELIESGLVTCETEPTGGKIPRTYFRAN